MAIYHRKECSLAYQYLILIPGVNRIQHVNVTWFGQVHPTTLFSFLSLNPLLQFAEEPVDGDKKVYLINLSFLAPDYFLTAF